MMETEKITNASGFQAIQFLDTEVYLLREKAIWVKNQKTLLISDLHFGKAAHFRKSGIPIPEPVHNSDLQIIEDLVQKWSPQAIYFLGDLFHSDWNGQWEVLMKFIEGFSEIEFHLVKGNHDVLPPKLYTHAPLKIHPEEFRLGNLVLSHEPLTEVENGFLNICGHIHPGILLRGKARQHVRIPCFYFNGTTLIMPAFGNFTGLALVKPELGDWVWGIAHEKVIPILSGTAIG
ncbi:ligase-associated DNA damage response endonuclease PdeM [Algoriphagus confluentis]|uniref:Ligase-associated DNA damage response endonuclease PdeM n=1 Tax=Algoriphagus confluentis TaxID=1697556 RepID=A0ABQ6PKS6_9BACT|nr:ligase-associated DNA damage response endonuclease PdeM [Algoriphagus confluentis]